MAYVQKFKTVFAFDSKNQNPSSVPFSANL